MTVQEFQSSGAYDHCVKCGSLRTPDVTWVGVPFDLTKWFDPNAWDKWAARYAAEHQGHYPTPEWGQEWLACACPKCGYSWEMKCKPE
jgi:hypothetical protein